MKSLQVLNIDHKLIIPPTFQGLIFPMKDSSYDSYNTFKNDLKIFRKLSKLKNIVTFRGENYFLIEQ